MNESTTCTDVSRPASERLRSIDAYRGLVMLAIASHGLGLAATAEHFPDSRAWQVVAHQFEHVPWVGCVVSKRTGQERSVSAKSNIFNIGATSVRLMWM